MNVSPTSFAAGAVAALVLATGGAYAATGGNFILGKPNSAGATTTLTNNNGTALALNAKSGAPALKVNTGAKVTNLNADKVDGRSEEAFALASGQVASVLGEGWWQNWGTEESPVWTVVATANCPQGTKMTGGGGQDNTPGGALWMSEPMGPLTWMVASTFTSTPDNYPDASQMMSAFALCWNPRGAVLVPSARSAAPEFEPTPELTERFRAKFGG